jgi:Ran GTPase-activating protein (RanGAP) involved in mRNA processing and transport
LVLISIISFPWCPLSLFTVDLRRFKNVETMKGERAIGRDGAVFLSFALSGGACPRLRHLNLGWNLIKKAGCDRLLDALDKLGAACLIELLDLRMNHLPGSCVAKLCRLLRRGPQGEGPPVLPKLEQLDLRQNVVGDEGGQALAHAALAGGLKTLRRLNVSANQMGDSGVRALHKAFSAEAVAELCPHIEGVNCRDNVLDPCTAKLFDPCPIFFQV